MHVQTHTGHRKKKKKRSQNGRPPHNPPPSHPNSSDTQSVYMCAHESEGGASGLEKGGNVPIRSLLNTFVSTARRDKHYRQAAARSRRRRHRCSEENGSVVRTFFSSSSREKKKRKRKDGRCISMINSVLIQGPEPAVVDLRRYDGLINAPSYTGGNAHGR